MQAIAAHYYCGTAGTATEFTDGQWLELLTRAVAVEGIVTGHRALMDRLDPERKIGLILDEWGAWHPVEEGKPDRGLYQQNTMRDALVAALSLDVFHNHADKLVMANIAQLINVLQALLLVDEEQVHHDPDLSRLRPLRGTSGRHRGAADQYLRGDQPRRGCRGGMPGAVSGSPPGRTANGLRVGVGRR